MCVVYNKSQTKSQMSTGVQTMYIDQTWSRYSTRPSR